MTLMLSVVHQTATLGANNVQSLVGKKIVADADVIK